MRTSFDSVESGRTGMDGTRANGVNGTSPTAEKGGLAKAPKVTKCQCGKDGSHYSETAMEAVFPGTPEKIHNLIFASGFIKDFMRDEQKLIGACPRSLPPLFHITFRSVECEMGALAIDIEVLLILVPFILQICRFRIGRRRLTVGETPSCSLAICPT